MTFYSGIVIGSLATTLVFLSVSPSGPKERTYSPIDEGELSHVVDILAQAPLKCTGVAPQLSIAKAWSTDTLSFIWLGIGEQQSINEMLEKRHWVRFGPAASKDEWDLYYNQTDAVFGDVMTLKKFLNDERFRAIEGKVLVNAVLGAMTITMSKINAWKNLDDLFRRSHCKLEDAAITPIQYELSNPPQCAEFFSVYGSEDRAWVLKMDGSSQGKAVTFHKDLEMIKHRFEQCDGLDRLWQDTHAGSTSRGGRRKGPRVLIQQYIKPFLIEETKSDYRSYMLIASTTPFIVFWREGYFRRSMVKFDMNADPADHPEIHLTNSAFQSNQEGFTGDKHIWNTQRAAEYAKSVGFYPTAASFRKYVVDYGLWMSQLLFKAAEPYLHRNRGTFELIGLDFMFADDGKLYFIEGNAVPGISAKWPSDWQRGFYWDIADETFELVLKIQSNEFPELLSQPFFAEIGGEDKEYGNWRLVYHEHWNHGFVPPTGPKPCPCNKGVNTQGCERDYFHEPLCDGGKPAWVNRPPK